MASSNSEWCNKQRIAVDTEVEEKSQQTMDPGRNTRL